MIASFAFKINLAPSYFPAELPLKYLGRNDVSQLSSRWVRVGPSHHRHQEDWWAEP